MNSSQGSHASSLKRSGAPREWTAHAQQQLSQSKQSSVIVDPVTQSKEDDGPVFFTTLWSSRSERIWRRRRNGRARNKNHNTGYNSSVLISLGTARRSRSVYIRRTHACERSLSLAESTRAINILIRPLMRMRRPVIGNQYWDGIVSVRSNYRSNAIHSALLWTGVRCGVRVQVTH